MKALLYLNKYLAQHKAALVGGSVAMLVSNALVILAPGLIKHAFDLVQESVGAWQLATSKSQRAMIECRLARGLLFDVGGVFILAILKSFFGSLAQCYFMMMGKRIEYTLRNEIYQYYQTMPPLFYRRHSTGELMTLLSEDVNRVGMYVGPAIMHVVGTATMFLLLVPYMWLINTRLTLYTMIPILLLSACTYYISTFMQYHARAIQAQLAQLTTFAQESFSGIRVLQSFVREKAFSEDFAQKCQKYQAQTLRLTTITALFVPAVIGIISLGKLFVVFIGGQEVIQGTMTPGSIAAFIMYLDLLSWPTLSVSWITPLVQRAAASQQRIYNILQAKNPIVSRESLKSPI